MKEIKRKGSVGKAHAKERHPFIDKSNGETFILKEGNEKRIQRKEETSSTKTSGEKISRSVAGKLQASNAKGESLSTPTRLFMEDALNTDFSGVNIHTGPDAVKMNKDLHAEAFTYGEDLYFNSGKYQPDTAAGKKLLAHELVHVGQKRKGNVIQAKRKAPTQEEILTRWLNKWERWEKKKIADPEWELGCGLAARTVFLSLGGKRWQFLFRRGKVYRNSRLVAQPKQCKDAKARSVRARDYLKGDTCFIQYGNPEQGGLNDLKKIDLLPGMVLWTAEECTLNKENKKAYRVWDATHIFMYYGGGKVLDALAKPKPKEFKPVYGRSDFFVVLEVSDPFKHLRNKE